MSSKRKGKSRRRFVLIISTLLLLLFGGMMFYKWIAYRKAKLTRYKEFGIAIPDGFVIHGIDVSRYQHLIAWEEVKKMEVWNIKMGFAFIKATEGIGNIDPQFRRNWQKARDNDIIRGAYHFFIPTKDGKMQAENFIDKVKLQPGDLPPVLDVETKLSASPATLRREVKRWLDVVEEHYGVKPIIYTNADFYRQYLGVDFDQYPLWVAHYYEPRQPRIGRAWHFWQHNDSGQVNGITSKVDFNVFNGDSASFRSLLVPAKPEE
jgi:lysozyme